MNSQMPKQPEVANEVVAAQIAAYDAEIAKLDAIIADAEGKKHGYVRMKEALTPLLTSKETAPPVSPVIVPGNHDIDQKMFQGLVQQHGGRVGDQHPGTANGSNGANGKATNTGFREAVRTALREHPKGLKPAELIQLLGDRGHLDSYSTKVRASERVYSELHSLKKSKKITKKYGRYVVVVEATNA